MKKAIKKYKRKQKSVKEGEKDDRRKKSRRFQSGDGSHYQTKSSQCSRPAFRRDVNEVAGMVAKRHTRANVITASVDNLRFIHGAYKGEMVVIVGKVTYVGTTSMEVRVDTYVEHMEDGMRRPINRAYFTMVALDEDDKPKQVPRLILETEAQRAEWKAAEKRREMRMRRKEEGF